jgi:hypothetical protein
VFERLFGEGGTVTERRAALQRRASLLDWVREDIASLRHRLGPADQAKVSEYLDTVREVERRIQRAEADAARQQLPADLDRPLGVPASYTEHAKLMLDLQVLALQGDVARVITFQLARETTHRTYAAELASRTRAHPLSTTATTRRSCAHGEDQCVPRVAVRLLPRAAQGHARRHGHAA